MGGRAGRSESSYSVSRRVKAFLAGYWRAFGCCELGSDQREVERLVQACLDQCLGTSVGCMKTLEHRTVDRM